MYNELEKVSLDCEAIMTAKRYEIHCVVINFMLESSPKQKREEVYVVATHRVVTRQSITNSYKLPTAKFMVH